MAEELFAKEKEFYKLNKELDERTRELMKEVDSVMESTNSTHLLSLNQNYSFKIFDDVNEKILNAPTLMDRQSEPLFLKQNVSLPSHFLDQSHNQLKKCADIVNFENSTKSENNSKTEIQLLKSKIKSQENEIQAIQTEFKKKCNYCKELEAESKRQTEVKEKLQNQVGSLKDLISKNEALNVNLQSKIQEQSVESSALKKEIEDLKKEIKVLNQQFVSTEVRLNRSIEEKEKLGSAVKFYKLDEKDLRDQIRKISEEKRLSIKSLEKQRSDLYQAYKKQMHLVDNLKKQKAYLEASKQIQITKEDFTKFLEWKPNRDL